MKNIIRTSDKIVDEVFVKYIFGLNVFRVNKVSRNNDLELKFLEFLSQNNLTSAHTGSLHDLADSPPDLFGLPDESIYYEEVKVGVFGGSFYSTDDWLLFPPCFFPKVNNDFWNIKSDSLDSDLQDILSWDALAVYVDPNDNNYTNKMKSLFDVEFESNEDWIKRVLEIYRLIIVSAGDANYLKVYANANADFDKLDNSLRKAEEIIYLDTWYQNNENNLIWDDENNMCLILSN